MADLVSDESFYRLVACAAPPGGDCAKPFVWWPRERRLRLRVGIAQISEGFADYRFDVVDRSVDRAIAEINGAGAHLFLERAFEGPFDIPIFLVDAPEGGRDHRHGCGRSRRVVDLDRPGYASLARGGDHRRRDRDFGRHPAPRKSPRSCWRSWCNRWGLSPTCFLRPIRTRFFFREPQFRNPSARSGRRGAAAPLPTLLTPCRSATAPSERPPQCSIPRRFRTISARSRDFPHEGILFRDVTTLFRDPRGFRLAVDQLLAPFVGQRIDLVAGLEARGFILGGAVAHQTLQGVRPRSARRASCPEGRSNRTICSNTAAPRVEMHDDAVEAGHKVLLVDDLLATGGTAEAGIRLIERLGGEVIGCAFVGGSARPWRAQEAREHGRAHPRDLHLLGALTQDRGKKRVVGHLEPAHAFPRDHDREGRTRTDGPVTRKFGGWSGVNPAHVNACLGRTGTDLRPARASVAPLSPVVWMTGSGPREAARARQSEGKCRQGDRSVQHTRRQPCAARTLVHGHPAATGREAG